MNIKQNKFIVIAVIFLLLFCSSILSQTVTLKLIETSDVHGAILPFDFNSEKSTSSSLAQVHTYVNVEKRKANQEVILLDNGDILQGDPIVYYYNYEDTIDPHAYAEAMNFMKYDAATVGNHDIETGHPVYDRFNKQLTFPWLAANAVNKDTQEPYFKPYTIVEREGIRIAVLGLITPSIPNWLPEKLWEGMMFEDMVESAAKWVEIIKEKERPDLLIGLFHAGVDYSYNYQDENTYMNENASQLVAEQVSGFDVVFVGHDHAGWNYKVENSKGDSVLILGALSKAKTVAVANIVMDYDIDKKQWFKKTANGEIVEIKEYKPDDMFMSKYLITLNVIENYVNKPVARLYKTISSRDALFGPSDFIDLIHLAQLELTGADVSFASPLSFDVMIDSGWIHVKDMFNLYRFENLLYTMEMSGEEIKNYLEFSFGNWFNQMQNEDDHLLKFKYNDDGALSYSERYGIPELSERYYNYSCASGIHYTVDISKPAGERVNITKLRNDSPFDLNKTYTVAINTYRGNGGGGHLILGAGINKDEISKRIINTTTQDLRFEIMKWLEEKKKIYPHVIGNWEIQPDAWWKGGKEKDYNLLFDKK